jgi:hypothetical protein
MAKGRRRPHRNRPQPRHWRPGRRIPAPMPPSWYPSSYWGYPWYPRFYHDWNPYNYTPWWWNRVPVETRQVIVKEGNRQTWEQAMPVIIVMLIFVIIGLVFWKM